MGHRIAVISEHASPLAPPGSVDSGGQNIYVDQTAVHLARLGYDVDVFTRRDRPDLPATQDRRGVRVVHVPAGPEAYVRKEELLPWMQPFADWMIEWIGAGHRYDLVHAHFWMSGLVASELRRALGLPFVVTFHALGKVRRRHQGEHDGFPDARFAIEERVTAEAARIIAESPQDRADLIDLYGADPERITVIPAGFDPAECFPGDRATARRALGIETDAPIVLQLGRVVPRKGIDNGIRGFARARSLWPEARMVIVGGEPGGHSPELERLRLIAEDEGLSAHCDFRGPCTREELQRWYAAADVFVTTPWYEPFGITPVEAMACGLPVVGSATGGIRHTVLDGETGFLVPANDPDALGDRLRLLLDDPELRRRMGARGVERAHRHYSWGAIAQDLARSYEEVVALASPARHTEAVAAVGAAPAAAAPAVGAASQTVADRIDSLLAVLEAMRSRTEDVAAIADALARSLGSGGKVLVLGNGGSATDAQHLVAELMGRFQVADRAPLPVLSLADNAAFVTAWANDASFETVFARQVEALAGPGDVVLGITTSGRSPNVLRALEAGRDRGATVLGLLGGDGGSALALCEAAVVVPSTDTQRIQEVHTLLVHVVAELVERRIAAFPLGRPTRLVA